MESELFLLSGELRAIAHILRNADYIQSVTGDCEFQSSLISVVSDYLYYKAGYCLKVSESGCKCNLEA